MRYINAVTGTDWEGSGVTPDIATSKDTAPQIAQVTALEKLIKEQPGYPFIENRKRALDELPKK